MRTPSFLKSLIITSICFVLIPGYFFNLGWVRVHLASHQHNNSEVTHQIANTVDEHTHSHHHEHEHQHPEPQAPPSGDIEKRDDQKQHHPHSVADHIALLALLVTFDETPIPDSARLTRSPLLIVPDIAVCQVIPQLQKARGPPAIS